MPYATTWTAMEYRKTGPKPSTPPPTPGSVGAVVCGGGLSGLRTGRDPLDFTSAGSYASGAVHTKRGPVPWAGGRSAARTLSMAGSTLFSTVTDTPSPICSSIAVVRSAVGLFGYAGYSSVISNLGLLNVSVAGSKSVGALVGVNLGEVQHSYAEGQRVGRSSDFFGDYAGGLVGKNLGTISGSRAAVAMSCGDHGEYIGGLAGGNQGTIDESQASGGVSCDNGARFWAD